MSKNDWQRIIKKQYTYKKIETDKIKGIVSLLYIQEVKSPLLRTYSKNSYIKIVDKNYYWLQIGLEDKNYWITAMYDNNKKLIQYYIDISLENSINYDDDSFLYDLFLDIVLLPNNEMFLLDEDELQDALKEGIINQKQYDLAYKIANKIMKDLRNDRNKLDEFCNKYLKILCRDYA